MRIALIQDITVVNIAEFDNLAAAQDLAVGIGVLPVRAEGIPVGIGDTYEDGCFYRDGEALTACNDPTVEQIAAENALLSEKLAELQRLLLEDEPADDQERKLREVNAACTMAIHTGVDVGTSEGVEHFALTENDQINIQNLVIQVQAGQQTVPYHADGKLCRPFTADEVMALATAATAHKTYHLTYCNHLREWVRRAEAEELDSIYYGVELPADLAESMAALLGNPVK